MISEAREAPAAERNKQVILEAIRDHLPPTGLVLEIASGTGQHVVHLASKLPALGWQPTDPDATMLGSIRAWLATGNYENVLNPVKLDTRSERWPIAHADAVLCCNMIHIAPWTAAEGLFRGAARILKAGAPLILYGPFSRGGEHTAPSNARFDADLRQRNADWGVRDLDDIATLAGQTEFRSECIIEMPANNLTVVFTRK